MFGSAILEIALGLILFYTVLSLVVMNINECISALFKLRAKNLEHGLKSMINDPRLVEQIYRSSVVYGLWKTDVPGTDIQKQSVNLPSYIPARQLANAVMDVLTTMNSQAQKQEASLEKIRQKINELPDGPFKDALRKMSCKVKTIEELKQSLDCWFDDVMDRAAGWYKRYMHMIGIGVSIVITIICNADTYQFIAQIYHDASLRGLAASYGSSLAGMQIQDAQSSSIAIMKTAAETQLPIGWTDGFPQTFGQWIKKIMGWIITIAAISLGAPFWFDMLNKIANIRLSGVKPERSNTCK